MPGKTRKGGKAKRTTSYVPGKTPLTTESRSVAVQKCTSHTNASYAASNHKDQKAAASPPKYVVMPASGMVTIVKCSSRTKGPLCASSWSESPGNCSQILTRQGSNGALLPAEATGAASFLRDAHCLASLKSWLWPEKSCCICRGAARTGHAQTYDQTEVLEVDHHPMAGSEVNRGGLPSTRDSSTVRCGIAPSLLNSHGAGC
jgi:hypothetical protein